MRNRRRNGFRRGFLEARSIVAIVVIVTLLPIVVSIFSIIGTIKLDYDSVNDEISLLQLRKIMLISYDIQNYGDELDFIYHNDDYKLSCINNRLVLSPGYQVFLNNVEYVNFYQRDGELLLIYAKEGYEKQTSIYKEKGICIDDFSSLDDELPFDSSFD